MSLQKITYSESIGLENEWNLSTTEFKDINLVVGKNSTGKSRLVNLCNGFSNLISGKRSSHFSKFKYAGEILLDGDHYSYSAEFGTHHIQSECLIFNDEEKLVRNADGSGHVWYNHEEKFIDFKVEPLVVAVQQYQDMLQHPYLAKLSKWARSTVMHSFGSEFGRNMAVAVDEALLPENDMAVRHQADPTNILRTYILGFRRFGDKFDDAIINDMREIGYNLSEVGADSLPTIVNAHTPLLGLYVVETDLGFRNYQLTISQGMFRALALIIHVNWSIFSESSSQVLLDDIGEGLDFERSNALIKLLICKIKGTSQQLIMTSNDRFVMNSVPLQYWNILKRQGRNVRSYCENNSSDEFHKFKYMGLNNFDFFTSNIFE